MLISISDEWKNQNQLSTSLDRIFLASIRSQIVAEHFFFFMIFSNSKSPQVFREVAIFAFKIHFKRIKLMSKVWKMSDTLPSGKHLQIHQVALIGSWEVQRTDWIRFSCCYRNLIKKKTNCGFVGGTCGARNEYETHPMHPAQKKNENIFADVILQHV